MKELAFPILLIFLAGCVSRNSVANKPEYQVLLGQRYTTTSELFLVENADYFSLESESRSQSGPTFDQFRNGEWKQHWTRPDKYLGILPKGTILETTDVVRQDHVEMGRTWEIHGVILRPYEFAGTSPVYLCYFTNLQNLYWQPGLEKTDTQPRVGENASRPTP